MKIKRKVFLFVSFFTLCFSIQSQSYDSVKPSYTELVHEYTADRYDGDAFTVLKYNYEAPREDIINFYRELFLAEGLKELKLKHLKDFEITSLVFNGDFKQVNLQFVPSGKEDADYYFILIRENTEGIITTTKVDETDSCVKKKSCEDGCKAVAEKL